MTILTLLIPVTLCMGAVGLGAFFWSLRSGQYEDLDGDGQRILYDEDAPLPPRAGKDLKETMR
jgi:cbb3-type cytochrome oxidase maturation protein